MIARFLLGPAGSGKTHRCREAARAALRARPDGPPLLFIAPKQATFQLERQLLEDGRLPGYTRLHILSFERLADWVRERLDHPAPPRLDEVGRLMVLRSLLNRERERLRTFRAAARLPGFAREVGDTLRELRQQQVGPKTLRRLADRLGRGVPLADKLSDLALLMAAEEEWLRARGLTDDQGGLEAAAAALRAAPADGGLAAAVWLDGFAEMTPRERELLAALLPHTGEATLAFCLESAPPPAAGSAPGKERSGGSALPDWLSPWGLVGQSCARLRECLAGVPGVNVVVETLPRDPARSRFARAPALAHLEAAWNAPRPFPESTAGQVEVVECRDPEAEIVAAAREIVRFVRAGARWRDVAVIARSLAPYHERLPQVFRRYDIPFFLDARESVAHHPLAELTRSTLRVLAFGWRHADWFAALKTGLLPASEEQVDRLENEALARGWEGARWRTPWPDPEIPALETLRRRLVTPVLALERALQSGARDASAGTPGPTGRELARGLHAFWRQLRVDRALERWAETAVSGRDAAAGGLRPQAHRTVLEQMIAWLRDVALAFPETRLPLREWLPILEAGLGSLTIGVVPPALDQVLVGAIDRSRNPELRLAILLGLNEGVFPAIPPPGRLLTEDDRATLATEGVPLGPDRRWRLGRERYYGYIACTRPRERLLLTHARQNAEGGVLNRSLFLDHLARLFPRLAARTERVPPAESDAVRAAELIVPALRRGLAEEAAAARLLEAPELDGLRPLFAGGGTGEAAGLRPEIAARLYGPVRLRLSASGLQNFAACPFKFYVAHGLRAEERRVFEVDPRRRGSFCHEVLARYHHAVRARGREWRDLSAAEAEALIERLAEEVAGEFEAGVFGAAARNRFQAESLTRHLREFIRCFTEWLRTSYRLDPVAVEWGFGGRDGDPPAWELPLSAGRRLALVGKIDRVDVARDPERNRRLVVVMDYKSSPRTVDAALLAAGVELQLPLYLLALLRLGGVDDAPGEEPLEPVGMFFVGLRPKTESVPHRGKARGPAKSASRWPHRGRLVEDERHWLDAASESGGSGQFGSARTRDSLSRGEFRALLEHTETQVREFGERIFAGEIRVDPYVKGSRCACDRCAYAGICRIDPWRHAYRRLPPPPASPQTPR